MVVGFSCFSQELFLSDVVYQMNKLVQDIVVFYKTLLRETRRLMMADLESSILKGKSPEDSIFYYH